MNVVEIYRVTSGTTRAILYFERTDEVCECVAEMIVERRLLAGLRSSPGAVRKIALMLRAGVKFVEDERGLIVPVRDTPTPLGPKPGPKPPPPAGSSPGHNAGASQRRGRKKPKPGRKGRR